MTQPDASSGRGHPESANQTGEPGPARASPGLVVVLLLIVALGGVGAYRHFTGPSHLHPAPADKGPPFVREGERIVIPDNSPLRGKLTVEAVQGMEIKRSLVLPAAVEA